MSIKRSVWIQCDRCSRESFALSWTFATGKKTKTVKELLALPALAGWRCVFQAQTIKGGSRRYFFCPDSICQAAANDVPQRTAPLRAAQKTYERAKARLEALGGKP